MEHNPDPATPAVRIFRRSRIPAVNVATVPQRSPLRYPGGKTWLVPHIRKWLEEPVDLLVEPFAGGGIVSLTAVMEGLAARAVMIELDRDVAAFWRAALEHTEELIERIHSFSPTRSHVERIARKVPLSVLDHGFRTLVLNRTRRGGILAPGASFIRNGENGNGICSRWYPDTLVRRLQDIARHSDKLLFFEGDGMRMLELLCDQVDAAVFVDPPYTAVAGEQAGSRLYTHNSVDHARIFAVLAASQADFLMTYDYSPDIVSLVRQHKFHGALVEMKSTHHLTIPELLITRRKLFT
ncbi:MAG: DNA adenine methylase [Bacteroidetes bacterium]|nr:DNA adenine methylase [Bacteroidota bacterium]